MKPVRTPESNVTLTLPGAPAGEGDLPAVRAMLVDATRNQTKEDAQLGYVTVWQPDDAEMRQLDAGGCVELTIWGKQHPPVAVNVTAGVVPEREMISRGHVDRALGLLYARLAEPYREAQRLMREDLPRDMIESIRVATVVNDLLPDAGGFVDLWVECVNETRAPEDGGTGTAPAPRDASSGPDANGQPA